MGNRGLNSLYSLASLNYVHFFGRRDDKLLSLVVEADLSDVFFDLYMMDLGVVSNPKYLDIIGLSGDDEFVIKLIPHELGWLRLDFKCTYFY